LHYIVASGNPIWRIFLGYIYKWHLRQRLTGTSRFCLVAAFQVLSSLSFSWSSKPVC
jgi:hypothetical protein